MDETNKTVIEDGKMEPVGDYRGPEDLYQDLIRRVKKYHPSDDISLIEKAYNLANDAHKEQVRKSGEPYIIHPLYVGVILAELEMDKETIAAGLLHDVVEDTLYTEDELKEMFGEDVTLLVDGVTKLQHFNMEGSGSVGKATDKVDIQAENLRKMFLAMAKDIRVIIIKLADRLHNMRTLKFMPPEKQQRIARETLDIYSPIADRLGISRIKVELDDLSLKYLEPEAYYDLVEKIDTRKSVREAYIQSIVDEVKAHIDEAGIHAVIDGRIKHFFSIYRKMVNQNKTLDQIYDLFAIRIIVDSIKDCYAALGVIHEMYTPIPGRFKDYIAMPKANMYQSLHTTLIGTGGKPFEVQIRTEEMHKAAEYGIAAHWKYKEASDGKKTGKDQSEAEKMAWLRQILEWQQDNSNNREFMNLVKSDLDLFSDQVYCFTPNGEVKSLPAGSTPIDFAYAVHSAVGNRMIGARVNGKLVTIEYEIQNGDRIEILTSQNSGGPSRDWLKLVKSTQARNKINQWFKQELKEDNIVKGREMIASYCKAKTINQSDIMTSDYMGAVMRKYGFHDWDSVLAAVGHGGLKEGQIVNRMVEYYDRDHKKKMTDEEVIAVIEENARGRGQQTGRGGIIVKGVHDVSVHFSKCCAPVPGDEIVGFITRGRGISIHRTDCVNVINLDEVDRERLIEAEWQIPEGGSAGQEKYLTEITIFSNNRSGLLADISRVLTEKGIDICSMNTRVSKQGIATLVTTFYISGREELNRIIEKLRMVESVLDVERTTG